MLSIGFTSMLVSWGDTPHSVWTVIRMGKLPGLPEAAACRPWLLSPFWKWWAFALFICLLLFFKCLRHTFSGYGMTKVDNLYPSLDIVWPRWTTCPLLWISYDQGGQPVPFSGYRMTKVDNLSPSLDIVWPRWTTCPLIWISYDQGGQPVPFSGYRMTKVDNLSPSLDNGGQSVTFSGYCMTKVETSPSLDIDMPSPAKPHSSSALVCPPRSPNIPRCPPETQNIASIPAKTACNRLWNETRVLHISEGMWENSCAPTVSSNSWVHFRFF